MNEILSEMYKNAEKLMQIEKKKENIQKDNIEEYKNNVMNKKQELENKIKEGNLTENRRKMIEQEILETNQALQEIEKRVREEDGKSQAQVDNLEIALLRGKYQIESKYEQQLGEFDTEMQKVEEQIKELQEQEKTSMSNIQNNMQKYMDLDKDGVPEDIRKNAEAQINDLDAKRENVTSYYAEQYAKMNAKMQDLQNQKKNVYTFAEPIVEQAREIAAVTEQKENRLEILQKIAKQGEEFAKEQQENEKSLEKEASAKQENKEEKEPTVETTNLEPATQEEQQKLDSAREKLAIKGKMNIPRAKIENIADKNVVDSIIKQANQERKDENQKTKKAQEIGEVLIEIKTGKVFIALKSEVDGKDNKFKVVDEIIYDREEKLDSQTLMEENKIALLRKNLPEFDKVASEVEQARLTKTENKEATQKYQEYMEKFQDVDPIVIQALDKVENVPAIEQYIEAVSSGKPEKMPFDLAYDLSGMRKSDFNLAQKQNIVSYAKANKKIAQDMKGLGSAQRHIKMREFENKHPWYKKIMTWLRAEDMPKAIGEKPSVQPKDNITVPKKEEFEDRIHVDQETKKNIAKVERDAVEQEAVISQNSQTLEDKEK